MPANKKVVNSTPNLSLPTIKYPTKHVKNNENDTPIDVSIETLLKTQKTHQSKKGEEVKSWTSYLTIKEIIRKLNLITGEKLQNVKDIRELLKNNPKNLDLFEDVYESWEALKIPVDKLNDDYIIIDEQKSLIFGITYEKSEIDQLFEDIRLHTYEEKEIEIEEYDDYN